MIGHCAAASSPSIPPQLTVEVSGVGYELEAPMSTFFDLPAAGPDVQLLTHLVVREDAHVLYGFGSEAERRLFRSLLKVSGVGPKIALGLLSGISVEGFERCVEAQDVGAPHAHSRRRAQDRRAADRGDARSPASAVVGELATAPRRRTASPRPRPTMRWWRSGTARRKSRACSKAPGPVHIRPRN